MTEADDGPKRVLERSLLVFLILLAGYRDRPSAVRWRRLVWIDRAASDCESTARADRVGYELEADVTRARRLMPTIQEGFALPATVTSRILCAAGHSVCLFPPVSFPLVDGAIGMFDSWLVEEGAVVRMLDRRRFPPPWFVEETPACFIVRDRAGQALAHLYYEETDGRSAANLLTKDEARRSATGIAKPL